MDPSSSNTAAFSSEFEGNYCEPADDWPEEKMITYMDAAFYEAAGEGKFENFKTYPGSELSSLRTPNSNTVLHVYLATVCPGRFDSFLEVSKPKPANFVEQILKKCPSLLWQPNAEGQTPLHIATKYGHSDVVKFLIKCGIAEATGRGDIGSGDIEKQQQGMEAAVREMLREKDKESNTALHVAAKHGNLEIVRALLEFEDPDFSYPVNESQETPVYIAAIRRRSHRLVAEMLDKCNITTVHAGLGPHGRTVLHAAVMGGDKETTKIILKKNGKLTRETDEKGQTPLHYAAHLGHYSVVRELLQCDKSAAYVADKDTGMTPLLMAARQGHEDIVSEIVSHCPDCCEIVDKNSGWNLLHFAAIRLSLLELHLFVEGQIEEIFDKKLYASIRFLKDKKDINGNTPLQVYVAARDHVVLEAEIKMGSSSYVRYDTEEVALCMKKLSINREEQILETVERVMSGEVAEVAVSYMVKLSDMFGVLDKTREAHLIVAALIATVTFAAAITLPGGFNGGDKGAELQGTAILIRNAAFKVFVITDALALVFSVVAIALHLEMSLFGFISQDSIEWAKLAAGWTFYAVGAMVVAFSTATYAVLQPSSGLAIATCCIGLSFFFFVSLTSQIKILRIMRHKILRMRMYM